MFIISDLAQSDDEARLSQMVELHRRWFPEHGHVVPDLEENFASDRRRGDVVVHQLLAEVDGVPAGYTVVYSNLRMSIGLVAFLAVEPEFRGRVIGPSTTAHQLVLAARDIVHADGVAAGRPITNGLAAESDPDIIPSWQRWGFTDLDVEYSEPYFGSHWKAHGEPHFFPMTLVNDVVTAHPQRREEISRAAAAAFHLDYYGLPSGHPVVQRAQG